MLLKCINVGQSRYLTKGKCYKMLNVNAYYIQVRNDAGIIQNYPKSSFDKVSIIDRIIYKFRNRKN